MCRNDKIETICEKGNYIHSFARREFYVLIFVNIKLEILVIDITFLSSFCYTIWSARTIRPLSYIWYAIECFMNAINFAIKPCKNVLQTRKLRRNKDILEKN